MRVKKKVVKREQIKEMALKKGAKVVDSAGQKFNAAGSKAPQPKMPPKKAGPKKAPAPEPAKADKGSELVADQIAASSKAMLMMIGELKDQISKIQLQSAQPPTEWVFDMVRDDKGYLKSIKATATGPDNKRLN